MLFKTNTKMFGRFLDSVDFISRCKKYGLGLWQCPNFLFLVMGLITVTAMFGTFFASERFADEGLTIMSVTLVAVLIMTLGSFVIRGVEKVAEANILKTEFISIISHQLCGPLSAIKWNVEILESEKESNRNFLGKEKIFLDNIKKSNEQMLKMVTDLLEVVRIDQGKAIFKEENLNLADLVRDSVSSFEGIAAQKNIIIESQIEKISQNIWIDRKKMRVVLDNLIGNAVKYSKEGGRVKVRLWEKDKKIIFFVRDWGVGIPRYQHGRVFEKFFRSSNDSRYRTDGVGIGLYLTRSILKHYGGDVWFESEAGKGSTFYFSLLAI